MTKRTIGQAVRQKCMDCIYDPIGSKGTWIQQVEDCTAYNCALYEHRPLTQKTREARKQAKIAAMSPEERAKYEKNAKRIADRLPKRRKSPEILR